MTRAEADLQLVRLINSALPELSLAIGRLHNDNLLTPADSELMIEAQRLLQEAAGRLLLRANPEPEIGFSGQEW